MRTAKKSNFIEWNNHIFVSSLKKIDLNIILIVVLDAAFYILSGYILLIWFQRIQAKSFALNLPSPAEVASLGYGQAQQVLAQTRPFLYLLIFSIIIIILTIIFLASIFKSIIWAKTTKTKISFALISRFLGLNLLWMTFWILLVFVINKEAVLNFFVVGLFFTNTLYTLFMKNQKLKSIFDAIRLSITKIHLFSIPYVVILLIFFIIVRLSKYLHFTYSTILVDVIILFYIALIRYYVSALVLEIEKA